jgi:hypothetical protein
MMAIKAELDLVEALRVEEGAEASEQGEEDGATCRRHLRQEEAVTSEKTGPPPKSGGAMAQLRWEEASLSVHVLLRCDHRLQVVAEEAACEAAASAGSRLVRRSRHSDGFGLGRVCCHVTIPSWNATLQCCSAALV